MKHRNKLRGNVIWAAEAARRYEAKAGWMSKSYKLKREDVEAFKATCDRLGISQAAQLTKMMREFVEQNKEK